jgi:heterodisulfide reductase subunit A-like polyferredoxin
MDLQHFLQQLITSPILFLYQLMQWVLDKMLSPVPPPPHAHLKRPKIAIIGAGLTGVSAASHCVGHGFDCRIFEAGPRKNLGGIWSVSPFHKSVPYEDASIQWAVYNKQVQSAVKESTRL